MEKILIDILIKIYLSGIFIHVLSIIFLIKHYNNSEYVFLLICTVGWPIFLVIEIFEYFKKKKNDQSS